MARLRIPRNLEVPYPEHELPPTYLINHDIKPIEHERRKWGMYLRPIMLPPF